MSRICNLKFTTKNSNLKLGNRRSQLSRIYSFPNRQKPLNKMVILLLFARFTSAQVQS